MTTSKQEIGDCISTATASQPWCKKKDTVGLGWAGLGWVGSKFLAFWWVGSRRGSETLPKILNLVGLF